ncbi:LysR substrate-binding domain-containing protein [Anderseniella sp. Alg231-50]|uniref:LysR substrate-binding domain-containing protein n=1 Tax=Anderseniella sp. Alg231-50 TaxID=1922226 RepID=UPI000D54EA44
MRLDIASLEVFQAVVRHGGVSKAAAQLNRVQSSVSTRIRQLEDQLGEPLFLRDNRRMTLTDAGRNLLPYAERMLTLAREAADAVKTKALSGTLRIGTMESTAAARLPKLLSRFHAMHPDVSIRLTTATAGALHNSLSNEEIDIAFIAEPVSNKGFQTLPVFTEELCLVAAKSFTSIEDTAALNGQTIVAFEEGCAYRRYLNDWLLGEQIAPGTTLAVGSYLAMLSCVSAGTGFAVIPKSVLSIVDVHETLQYRMLPGRYARIKTLMAWRKNYTSPKLNTLQELLAVKV